MERGVFLGEGKGIPSQSSAFNPTPLNQSGLGKVITRVDLSLLILELVFCCYLSLPLSFSLPHIHMQNRLGVTLGKEFNSLSSVDGSSLFGSGKRPREWRDNQITNVRHRWVLMRRLALSKENKSLVQNVHHFIYNSLISKDLLVGLSFNRCWFSRACLTM